MIRSICMGNKFHKLEIMLEIFNVKFQVNMLILYHGYDFDEFSLTPTFVVDLERSIPFHYITRFIPLSHEVH
jgi:hypothetical protein